MPDERGVAGARSKSSIPLGKSSIVSVIVG
jgi:hypothetical protein